VTRVEFGQNTNEDFDRILAHLAAYDAEDVEERIGQIVEACGLLARHPLIGRDRPDQKRELVIGSVARGYVALYRFVEESNLVLILAIRAQREKGFARGL
jgi:toxin ParE1/3/4